MSKWYSSLRKYETRLEKGGIHKLFAGKAPKLPSPDDVFDNSRYMEFLQFYFKIATSLGAFQEMGLIYFELMKDEMFAPKKAGEELVTVHQPKLFTMAWFKSLFVGCIKPTDTSEEIEATVQVKSSSAVDKTASVAIENTLNKTDLRVEDEIIYADEEDTRPQTKPSKGAENYDDSTNDYEDVQLKVEKKEKEVETNIEKKDEEETKRSPTPDPLRKLATELHASFVDYRTTYSGFKNLMDNFEPAGDDSNEAGDNNDISKRTESEVSKEKEVVQNNSTAETTEERINLETPLTLRKITKDVSFSSKKVSETIEFLSSTSKEVDRQNKSISKENSVEDETRKDSFCSNLSKQELLDILDEDEANWNEPESSEGSSPVAANVGKTQSKQCSFQRPDENKQVESDAITKIECSENKTIDASVEQSSKVSTAGNTSSSSSTIEPTVKPEEEVSKDKSSILAWLNLSPSAAEKSEENFSVSNNVKKSSETTTIEQFSENISNEVIYSTVEKIKKKVHVIEKEQANQDIAKEIEPLKQEEDKTTMTENHAKMVLAVNDALDVLAVKDNDHTNDSIAFENTEEIMLPKKDEMSKQENVNENECQKSEEITLPKKIIQETHMAKLGDTVINENHVKMVLAVNDPLDVLAVKENEYTNDSIAFENTEEIMLPNKDEMSKKENVIENESKKSEEIILSKKTTQEIKESQMAQLEDTDVINENHVKMVMAVNEQLDILAVKGSDGPNGTAFENDSKSSVAILLRKEDDMSIQERAFDNESKNADEILLPKKDEKIIKDDAIENESKNSEEMLLLQKDEKSSQENSESQMSKSADSELDENHARMVFAVNEALDILAVKGSEEPNDNACKNDSKNSEEILLLIKNEENSKITSSSICENNIDKANSDLIYKGLKEEENNTNISDTESLPMSQQHKIQRASEEIEHQQDIPTEDVNQAQDDADEDLPCLIDPTPDTNISEENLANTVEIIELQKDPAESVVGSTVIFEYIAENIDETKTKDKTDLAEQKQRNKSVSTGKSIINVDQRCSYLGCEELNGSQNNVMINSSSELRLSKQQLASEVDQDNEDNNVGDLNEEEEDVESQRQDEIKAKIRDRLASLAKARNIPDQAIEAAGDTSKEKVVNADVESEINADNLEPTQNANEQEANLEATSEAKQNADSVNESTENPTTENQQNASSVNCTIENPTMEEAKQNAASINDSTENPIMEEANQATPKEENQPKSGHNTLSRRKNSQKKKRRRSKLYF